MSKELTEQWRNGTLPFGMYYVKSTYGDIKTDETVYLVGKKRYRWRYTDICCVEEIIAPVPTYKEYLKLESDSLAKQEGVELVAELEYRLKEAENIILLYFKNTQNATHQSLGMNDGYYKKAFMHTVAKEYLEKYGVEK